MRVLMVCPSYPPRDRTCGVGDYTRGLAEALARLGEDVTVLARPGYRGANGVVPVATSDRITPGRWPAVDVVNVQYTPDLYRDARHVLLAPLRARLLRPAVPTVVTFHSLVDGSLVSRLAAAWLLATAAAAISTNEEVTGMIRRRLPALARRLVEIPLGASVPQMAGAGATARALVRGKLGLPAGGPLLAHFGLVYPGKGLETLLEALASVRRAEPETHLAVVGDTRAEDRAYRETLEARAARLGLAGAVTWTGALGAADVSRAVTAADLFVLPFDAGASIRRSSLIAGLALGVPVVTTTLAVPSAYLRDGENVSLVPPRDPAALATRIVELLRAPDVTARLTRGARDVAARFAWPQVAAATRDVLRRVAER